MKSFLTLVVCFVATLSAKADLQMDALTKQMEVTMSGMTLTSQSEAIVSGAGAISARATATEDAINASTMTVAQKDAALAMVASCRDSLGTCATYLFAEATDELAGKLSIVQGNADYANADYADAITKYNSAAASFAAASEDLACAALYALLAESDLNNVDNFFIAAGLTPPILRVGPTRRP